MTWSCAKSFMLTDDSGPLLLSAESDLYKAGIRRNSIQEGTYRAAYYVDADSAPEAMLVSEQKLTDLLAPFGVAPWTYHSELTLVYTKPVEEGKAL